VIGKQREMEFQSRKAREEQEHVEAEQEELQGIITKNLNATQQEEYMLAKFNDEAFCRL